MNFLAKHYFPPTVKTSLFYSSVRRGIPPIEGHKPRLQLLHLLGGVEKIRGPCKHLEDLITDIGSHVKYFEIGSERKSLTFVGGRVEI